jgi:large subunit ribosomal protein L25
MEQVELQAQKRHVFGKKVKRLRAQGLIPAIIYGRETEPIPIQVEERELIQTLQRAGANRIIAIKVDGGEPHLTLAREIQRDFITHKVLHVDFQEVVMTRTIVTEVPIHLEGTPPPVERGEAILQQMLDSIEVEALPMDLIPGITIDVSGLEEIDDAILVGDLELPERIKVLNEPDEMIVRVAHLEREEEEVVEEVPEEEVEVEVTPEVVTAKAEEEEEAAEE